MKGAGGPPRRVVERPSVSYSQPHDAAYEDLAARLLEHLEGRESWQRAVNVLAYALGDLVESAERELDDDSLMALLVPLIAAVSRIGFASEGRKERVFEEAERLGVHVLPVGYSSPVPDTRALSRELWKRRFDGAGGLELDSDTQLVFLERLAPWAHELDSIDDDRPDEHGFSWSNGQFNRTDATIYYCLLRERRPGRILEVGGGFSTLIACRAATRNGATEVICVDPAPRAALADGVPGLARLVRAPVQDVDLAEFAALAAGDVLFVDSSHVSRVGSDVNRIVLDVLPSLAPGVLVHFHDVFLPWDYPEEWVRRQHFWNEQYLLHAFLLLNDAYEILWTANLVGTERADAVRRILGIPSGVDVRGSSVWLRRTEAG